MSLESISSFSALWVYVLCSNGKPLGLGAQYFIELIRAKQPSRKAPK